jgi:tetratricopeptide (TPR) repeat protein
MAAARQYFEQARAMNQAFGHTQGSDMAFLLTSCGTLLHDLGDHKQAQAALEHALVIWEHVGGVTHPERVVPLTHLARVLLATGRVAAAQSCVDQAVLIGRNQLGAHHPQMAETLVVHQSCMVMSAIRDMPDARSRSSSSRMRRQNQDAPASKSVLTRRAALERAVIV